MPATRTLLAAAIVALIAATEAALLFTPVPTPVRDILQVVVGVLIAKFGTVYDYYFGSSKPEGEGAR
ncbi:MAG: hypothetical protein ACYDD1_11790 [Caulobacteraceae bacterium]